jgi:hypothetical protein
MREATWMQAPRLDPAAVKKVSSLVAFADALSLALCGYLNTPMTLEAPAQNGDLIRIEFTDRPGRPFEFVARPLAFLGSRARGRRRGAAFAAGGALLKRSRDAVLAGGACAGNFQGNAVRGLIRPLRRWILPNRAMSAAREGEGQRRKEKHRTRSPKSTTTSRREAGR